MANIRLNQDAARNRLASMAPREEAGPPVPPSGNDPFAGRKALREAALIRYDRIERDSIQPRQEFDAESLERLARSLKERGQLQPIRVRWDEGRGVYVIVLGERRWRAAGLAGLEMLSCVVVDGNPTQAELLEDQLVENCLREDLKPTELANAYRSLMNRLGLTQTKLAERLNISQTAVSQAMAILGLPIEIKQAIDAGKVSRSVGYEASKLKGAEAQVAMVDAAALGATRAQVRAVTSNPRAGKVKQTEFRFPDGTVTVAFATGQGDDATTLILLELAIKDARRAVRVNRETDAA